MGTLSKMFKKAYVDFANDVQNIHNYQQEFEGLSTNELRRIYEQNCNSYSEEGKAKKSAARIILRQRNQG